MTKTLEDITAYCRMQIEHSGCDLDEDGFYQEENNDDDYTAGDVCDAYQDIINFIEEEEK